MRITVRTALAMIACALLTGGATAADPPAKAERVISVTGTATVHVKPDVARVYYGIRAQEPSVDAVKDVLTKLSGTMDEGIKKLKLTGLKITSAPVSIQQSQRNDDGPGVALPPGGAPAAPMAAGLGPYVGHTSHTATITDTDPDKLRVAVDAFVKAVVETGSNTAGDIRETNADFFPGRMMNGGPKVILSRADDSAAREEALQKAVERAMKNAKAIAKALGGGEVKVIAVEEDGEAKATPDFGTFGAIYGLESAGHKSPAGEVEVKVRVVVKCSY
ncbi:MAG TPA: SIMPL domain-containing protein [Gemmataceae bacterium]|nr:SIMPL domain-containing protein [Gemmataceae bacterium]